MFADNGGATATVRAMSVLRLANQRSPPPPPLSRRKNAAVTLVASYLRVLPLSLPSAQTNARQEYMSRSLGVPATQHAFEDVALQFQAMKMNLNPEVIFFFTCLLRVFNYAMFCCCWSIAFVIEQKLSLSLSLSFCFGRRRRSVLSVCLPV